MVEKLRQSKAAAALICRDQEGEVQWLARWNKNWRCYYFVGGHKHDDESFRECIVRELHEELGSRDNRDILVSDAPLHQLQFVGFSKSLKVETEYTLELFDVRFTDAVQSPGVSSNQVVRWLSEREIKVQLCDDGWPVSETMVRVLNEIGWKCPCYGPRLKEGHGSKSHMAR